LENGQVVAPGGVRDIGNGLSETAQEISTKTNSTSTGNGLGTKELKKHQP
jgi:hypothetical protein